jgi:hypothetical protein
MQIDNVTLLHIAEPGLQIHLRYSGPLVDDGTISLEDVVKRFRALLGTVWRFASTYMLSLLRRISYMGNLVYSPPLAPDMTLG